uniref:Core shell protein Gag P30 domain-containing protein n=1 Tax=Cyanistes caeruleus TaxID=156563 RepID=A0A8C0ZAH2_CYACU
MIHYCIEVWPKLEMKGQWPWYGTKDPWMCSQLYQYLKTRRGSSPEEISYAALWLKQRADTEMVKVCKLKEEKGEGKESKKQEKEASETGSKWDPLDHLPPPPTYPTAPQTSSPNSPTFSPSASPPQNPCTPDSNPFCPNQSPSTSSASSTIPIPFSSIPPPLVAPVLSNLLPISPLPPETPTSDQVSSPSPSTVPLPPPNWELSTPKFNTNPPPPNNQQLPRTPTPSQEQDFGDGPYCHTRSKTTKLLPLREVPMGGVAGGVGFVNAPLTASEVRGFKKELGNLVEDPVGIANQVDQFLGPNTYTWGELNSILNILFNPEEVAMIRTAGIRIWERENRSGLPGEYKLPQVDPGWDPNREEGRRNMRDYRSLIVKGIKESVPRGNNTKLAFDGTQEKDETPATWLNRLRRNFQLYSNIDPDSPEGQVLLKVQFVTKSWPDIRRKLEKLEDWQEKGINELLKEALKVYLRREE